MCDLKSTTVQIYVSDPTPGIRWDLLNLHHHDLAVAHRGAGLVCYSVTYLEYKSACPAVYAIPLSHISDIRELARNFLESDKELYFKRTINIHGKLDAPSLIKY